MFRGEKLIHQFHPFVQPCQENPEHLVPQRDVPLLCVLNLSTPCREVVHVGLVEVDLHGVQQLNELHDRALSNLSIQRVFGEMVLPQVLGDQTRNMLVGSSWPYRIGPPYGEKASQNQCRHHRPGEISAVRENRTCHQVSLGIRNKARNTPQKAKLRVYRTRNRRQEQDRNGPREGESAPRVQMELPPLSRPTTPCSNGFLRLGKLRNCRRRCGFRLG